MNIISSLSREQKESIGLLQIGTFLEYFDLMLYIHMVVLLNELFFPKTDPYTASLLTALAFSITFVFRPIGALIFGWLGDHIGRKSTIVITTSMMAISCIVMANLPTYAQIGLAATWIMMLCRIAQGMSSVGEIVGAEIYLTESIGQPARYPAVASLSIFISLGGCVALGMATLVTSFGLSWRLAFWIGASIAIIGAFARRRLRETPEFLEAKRQWLKKEIHQANLESDPEHGAQINATWKEPVDRNTLIAFFLVYCGWPLSFYLGFMYFNPTLKESFGYSAQDIIQHNFFLSVVSVMTSVTLTFLTCFIHPLKILKTIGTLALLVMISLPFWIMGITSPLQLFLMQALILALTLCAMPADAIFFSYFPLYRRFTYASLLFTLARALMFAVTSFALVCLVDCFNHFGIWIVSLPCVCAYLYGIYYFERLERCNKSY